MRIPMMHLGQDLMKALNAQRRKAGLLIAVALAGAVAGCGGSPALTSRATESNLTSPYFDAVVFTQEPRDMERVAKFLEMKITRLDDNKSNILEPKITSAGGVCNRIASEVRCQINRRIVSNDCFRGSCSLRLKQWTMLISWRDQSGAIQPRVKINMTTQQLPN
jgi:hypothetical protein